MRITEVYIRATEFQQKFIHKYVDNNVFKL